MLKRSALFQNAMPLDTHEAAKSSGIPSYPNLLSNFSQLGLNSDLAAASESFLMHSIRKMSSVQSQNIPPEKLWSVLLGEMPVLTKRKLRVEILRFYKSQ